MSDEAFRKMADFWAGRTPEERAVERERLKSKQAADENESLASLMSTEEMRRRLHEYVISRQQLGDFKPPGTHYLQQGEISMEPYVWESERIKERPEFYGPDHEFLSYEQRKGGGLQPVELGEWERYGQMVQQKEAEERQQAQVAEWRRRQEAFRRAASRQKVQGRKPK